jgi:hypothetical protein
MSYEGPQRLPKMLRSWLGTFACMMFMSSVARSQDTTLLGRCPRVARSTHLSEALHHKLPGGAFHGSAGGDHPPTALRVELANQLHHPLLYPSADGERRAFPSSACNTGTPPVVVIPCTDAPVNPHPPVECVLSVPSNASPSAVPPAKPRRSYMRDTAERPLSSRCESCGCTDIRTERVVSHR